MFVEHPISFKIRFIELPDLKWRVSKFEIARRLSF